MIYIGLGANLPGEFGKPEQTIMAAQLRLEVKGIDILCASRTWLTAPVPVSDQPWYRNAVIGVTTDLKPRDLLTVLLETEKELGRVRSRRNDSRVIDLDILSYDDQVSEERGFILPHPRMHERGFVLYPLREIAPDWRHPALGVSVNQLIEKLPPEQGVKLSEDQAA